MASPLFLLTFIIGPVGMILALWRKYFLLAALNLFGTLSFFILMFLVYWLNSF
ncbi:hypothetical protein JCM19047_2675 [Bacillus sp. JCM 19047]|nr:hypothetical protein JCM19047_2675 [Bacillus sp. JCM 19047]